jgi:predicted phage terminase large subunit-like protein
LQKTNQTVHTSTRESSIDLEIDRRLMASSYAEFFKGAWNVIEPAKDLVWNWHIGYIASEVQKTVRAIVEGRPARNLIINVPPGTTKSRLVTIALHPWAWIDAPYLKIISASYDQSLATTQAIISRDLIQSEWYQLRWGDRFKLKFDQNVKTEYSNDKTGMRIATSVGGRATGRHGDLWIVDDPMDPRRAASEILTKRTNEEWWDHTVSTRSTDKRVTAKIIVMQRLSMNDLTGHILKKDGQNYKLICLPGEETTRINPPELKDRYRDGLLDPIRLDRKMLDQLKIDLGSKGYANQVKQDPVPDEGDKFKRAWFNHIPEKDLPPGLIWDLWIDGAYTEETQNDPTDLRAMAYDARSRRLYVRHAAGKRLEMPELLKYVPAYAKEHGCNFRSRIFIEPKASGKTLKQLLAKETNLNAIEIKSYLVGEGKAARADAATPTVEAGRVYLVEGSYVEDFLQEVCGFPGAEHDEQVDNLSYAVGFYFNRGERRGTKKRN